GELPDELHLPVRRIAHALDVAQVDPFVLQGGEQPDDAFIGCAEPTGEVRAEQSFIDVVAQIVFAHPARLGELLQGHRGVRCRRGEFAVLSHHPGNDARCYRDQTVDTTETCATGLQGQGRV